MDPDFYDFILRFDRTKTPSIEINRVLNKVRALLNREGFKIEKSPEIDQDTAKVTKKD